MVEYNMLMMGKLEIKIDILVHPNVVVAADAISRYTSE